MTMQQPAITKPATDTLAHLRGVLCNEDLSNEISKVVAVVRESGGKAKAKMNITLTIEHNGSTESGIESVSRAITEVFHR
jgi:hypothetical protein